MSEGGREGGEGGMDGWMDRSIDRYMFIYIREFVFGNLFQPACLPPRKPYRENKQTFVDPSLILQVKF